LSLGTPPALGGLDYLCRAITPEDRPIRFDARFFVGDASLASGIIGGSGELEALEWYELDALLKLDLAPVTREVLGQLQAWLNLNQAERTSRPVPVFRYPNWETE
jgi:8-oxo-dGTP pyrophosphatase MutT (NUDIX family)